MEMHVKGRAARLSRTIVCVAFESVVTSISIVVQHRAANPTVQTQMRFSGTTVQPLGCRNRMNNGCGIGASFPAVSTWIAGLSQAELVSERRPGFKKAIK
jgi:hypothetical protein